MVPPVEVLSRPQVRRAALAVLLALASALVLAVLSGSGTSTASGRLGGDYPEFYGAGKILLDGDVGQLYEVARQTAAQAPYTGLDGGLLYFGYPPHVAAAYVPLAALPYRLSWVFHTALMIGAAIGGFALLRPMLEPLRRAFVPCIALGLTFPPLFIGVALGQNTGLSLLLIAASWRLAHDERDGAAGVALGLLLFKPQLALPFIALHLVAGRWRVAAGAAATGGVTWVIGSVLMGTGWVSDWLGGLADFGDIDRASNATNAVSILGVADALADGARPATVAAVGLNLVIAVLVVVVWRRSGRDDLSGAMAVAVPAVLLVAPHALYYDAGLIALTGAVVLARAPRSLLPLLATWALALAHGVAATIGATPVGLTVAIALVAAWRVTRPAERHGPIAMVRGARSFGAAPSPSPRC